MTFKTRQLSSILSKNAQSCSSILSAFNRHNAQRYPFLLSSSAVKQNNTQYDILIAFPQYDLILNSDKSLSCSNPDITLQKSFLDTLENLLAKNTTDAEQNREGSELPFTGGWFVYLSYEMAAEVEPYLKMPTLPLNQPLAVASRCPVAIVVDKENKKCMAVAETAYAYLLDEIESDLSQITKQEQKSSNDSLPKVKLTSLTESDPAPYLLQVEKIKQYIIEGDIFQANLSRQWSAKLKNKVDDATLFDTLSQYNPSSFAAMACFKGMTIISSSPERLVSLNAAVVETRPIAGTRRRDDNQQNDDALAEELLAHPKEQAEHIMLIDLERNDLGRVCIPGSIEVNELMALETWQHVHHIVSNVRGQLASDKSTIDVLRAVFPGGTITGCPKVRCIEILVEMEQQARGAYTGSLGYINNSGDMDFNILIRTIVREENNLSFRAGGGIVSDSIAEKELEETRAKAKGLLKMFKVDNE
jgi:anthranilate synthase component 1